MSNSVVATDAFTRADNATMGTGWTESEGDTLAIQISSNTILMRAGHNSSTQYCCYNKRSEAHANNQYAKAKLTARPGNGGGPYLGGLVVRGSGTVTSFTGYAFTVGAADGSWQLLKFSAKNLSTAAQGTVLTSGAMTGNVALNDIFELRANGQTISVLKNGAAFTSTTDSAIASGAPGFMSEVTSQGDSSAPFSNWDDWESGDILPDAQAVTGATIAAGSTTAVPTITTTTSVVGATIASGSVVNAPTMVEAESAGGGGEELAGVVSLNGSGLHLETITDSTGLVVGLVGSGLSLTVEYDSSGLLSMIHGNGLTLTVERDSSGVATSVRGNGLRLRAVLDDDGVLVGLVGNGISLVASFE